MKNHHKLNQEKTPFILTAEKAITTLNQIQNWLKTLRLTETDTRD